MNTLDLEVLVLNKQWVPIQVKGLQSCLSMMASGAAKGLDFTAGSCIPLPWSEWLKLPVREGDDVIHTTKLSVRAPRVILLTKYSKVPTKRRRMSMRNVCEYYDNTCAYTGKKLSKHTRSLDHVVPKSKGGKSTWENVVPCDRELNSIKADRTPKEAGLQLRVVPHEPRRVPFTEILRKRELTYEEWGMFIKVA
jgi:5-methylcytosine-specific restriction endonuclease McrA